MRQNKGVNIQQLRQRNRAVVLKMICTSDKISRIELSRKAGLTKMTLTNIAGELIQNGFISEYAIDKTSTVGRKPIMLDISNSSPVVMGIQISRDNCHGIVCDAKLNSLYEYQLPLGIGETNDSLVKKVCAILHQLQANTKRTILGIGIACIGPLDSRRGRILNPPNFYGISDLDLVDILVEKFELPVFFDNDMNASALAELNYGFGMNYSDYIFLGLTNGVGAGIVSSGSLLRGEYGISGEIGHTTVCFDGPLCSCGRKGCLETYVSVPVLLQKARSYTVNPTLQWADFIRMAENNEAHMQSILSEAIAPLSAALANAVNLLDTRLIIIGLEGVHFPAVYLCKLEESINQLILAKKIKSVHLVCSAFGEKTSLYGSAALAIEELLFKTPAGT